MCGETKLWKVLLLKSAVIALGRLVEVDRPEYHPTGSTFVKAKRYVSFNCTFFNLL